MDKRTRVAELHKAIRFNVGRQKRMKKEERIRGMEMKIRRKQSMLRFRGEKV